MAKKLRELLLLAIDLQSSSIGLTKSEIIEKCNERGFSPSKRTIERWLADLNELGLNVEKYKVDTDHHNINRYNIKNLPSSLMNLSEIERSSLERLSLRLNDQTEKKAISKIVASQNSVSKAILNDMTELINNTYYAGLITPKIIVDEDSMSKIENAIKGLEIIKFEYQSEDTEKNNIVEVKPLGLLFGRFGYLICMSYKKEPMTYRLDLITNVQLTENLFEKPKDFNFKEYAKNSFGVFQGDKIINAKIWFDKSIADRVQKINFHPSQIFTKNKDKSVTLSLLCSGHRELIWEILHPDYLGLIKIIGPKEFIDEAKKYLSTIKSIY